MSLTLESLERYKYYLYGFTGYNSENMLYIATHIAELHSDVPPEFVLSDIKGKLDDEYNNIKIHQIHERILKMVVYDDQVEPLSFEQFTRDRKLTQLL